MEKNKALAYKDARAAWTKLAEDKKQKLLDKRNAELEEYRKKEADWMIAKMRDFSKKRARASAPKVEAPAPQTGTQLGAISLRRVPLTFRVAPKKSKTESKK